MELLEQLARESVDYNMDPKFKEDMLSIFSTTQQEVDEYMSSSDGKSYRNDFHAVRNSVIPKFKDAVEACVEKYTGLPIEVSIPDVSFAIFPIATMPRVGVDDITSGRLFNEMSGKIDLGEFIFKKGREKHLEETIEKIRKNFDSDRGFIHFKKLDRTIRKQMGSIIFFDLNTTFMAKHALPKSIESPNSRQLCAIFLHEVGHSITFLERLGDHYCVNSAIQKYTDWSSDNLTPVEQVERAANLYPYVKQNKLLPEDSAEHKILEYMHKAVNTEGSGVMDIVSKGGRMAILLAYLATVAATTTLGFAATVFTSIPMTGAVLALFPPGRWRKTGDLHTSRSIKEKSEEWADAYVVNMGMGGDMAQGLSNLTDTQAFLSQAGWNWIATKDIKDSGMFSFLIRYISTLNRAVTTAFVVHLGEVHGTNIERIEKMVRNQAKQFKAVAPNYAGDLIEQYERTLKILEREKGKLTKMNKAQEVFHRMYAAVIQAGPTRVHELLTEKSFEKEAQRFNTMVESMMGNKMHYQSAKLSQFT